MLQIECAQSEASVPAESEAITKQNNEIKNDAVVKSTVMEGFKQLDVAGFEGSKVSQNAMCQSVAMTAGTTAMFFNAFQDFARSAIKMPSEAKQEKMDAIQQQAMEAYRETFSFCKDYAGALIAVGSLPQNFEFMEVLVEANFVECESCKGNGCDFKWCKRIGKTPRLKVCDECDGTGMKDADADDGDVSGKAPRQVPCFVCGATGKVPDTMSCRRCEGKGNLGPLIIKCKKCHGVGQVKGDTCDDCNGTGEQEETKSCNKCKGRGKVQDTKGAVDECDECGGTGKDENQKKCVWCSGKGKCKPWDECPKCDEGRVPVLKPCFDCKATGQVPKMPSKDRFKQAGGVENVQDALVRLKKGADVALVKSFEIIERGMALQAEASTWESHLKDEKAKKETKERLLLEVQRAAQDPELLEAKAEEARCREDIKHYEEKVKELEKKSAQTKEKMEKDFEAFNSAFLNDQTKAKEQMRALHDQWNRQNNERLTKQLALISSLNHAVQNPRKRRVDHTVTTQGWWWFASPRTYTETSHVTDTADLEKTKQALSEAQNQYSRMAKEVCPYNLDSEMKTMSRKDFGLDAPLYEDTKADTFRQVLSDLTKTQSKNKQVVVAKEKVLATKHQEYKEAETAWAESNKKLLAELELDGGCDAEAKAMINAFKAGQKFSQANAAMTFMKETSSFGIASICNGLKHVLDALSDATDLIEQYQMLATVKRKLCDNEGEVGLAVQWLKCAGPRYNPLPPPDQVNSLGSDPPAGVEGHPPVTALAQSTVVIEEVS